MSYPDACIQSLVSPWWVPQNPKRVERGALVRAAIPYASQQPMELVTRGRSDDRDHGHAEFELRQFNIRQRLSKPATSLPVAALPERPGERRLVYRAKIRPGIIVGCPDKYPPSSGSAGWMTAPMMLIAPSFGVDQDGSRGGWSPPLVRSIRLCQHPQFLWDQLPHDTKVEESIICLDRLMPVLDNSSMFEYLGFKLSEDALAVVDDWLDWCRTGMLRFDPERPDSKSVLLMAHEELPSL